MLLVGGGASRVYTGQPRTVPKGISKREIGVSADYRSRLIRYHSWVETAFNMIHWVSAWGHHDCGWSVRIVSMMYGLVDVVVWL